MKRGDVVIETARLRMREWRPEDEALLERHCNTTKVMEPLGGMLEPAEHRKFFLWLLNEQQKVHGHTFWAVERKRDGLFLGLCGLVVVDEADSTVLGAVEIGWRIRADKQRKGYAGEAAAACLEYAFETLGAYRVVSRTYAQNVPSWGLMKKLKMWHDPRLAYVAASDEGSHPEPMIVHVLTCKDWKRTETRPIGTATWMRPLAD